MALPADFHSEIASFLGNLLSLWGWIFVLGVLHACAQESARIWTFARVHDFTKKGFATLLPLARRLLYVPAGLALASFSYMLTRAVYSGFALRASTGVLPLESGATWWDAFLYPFMDMFAPMTLFLLSGISLALSAGGRWLVNLAKLLATLAVATILISILASIRFNVREDLSAAPPVPQERGAIPIYAPRSSMPS